MSANHKLATILFADIAGYTTFMQKDEERALELLNRFKKSMEEVTPAHQGQIVQYYGDGCLLSFESSTQGVHCAMALQKAFQDTPEIPVRMGMHLGEVVFKNEGVFGDGVNIASRIESLGVPGAILLSRTIRDQLKNKSQFEVTALGAFRFKNVEEPMDVFALVNEGFAVPKPEEMQGKVRARRKSIAVLPFRNMSSDPEQEYFCDGMSEEIINALTHIENLKVIARTSAFEFKNKDEDIRKIGKKLDVSTLLEGSVRKAGTRLRITAQLINVADGSHLWSERYDREMKDVFEIQDEISMAIVDKFKIQLFEKEREKILRSKTQNLEAYNYYLKGRYHWNKRTKEGLENSIKYFKKSVEIDRDFSLAYTGLADAYNIQSDWGYSLPKDGYQKALKNVLKSLEIDNSLGETYVSLAYLNGFYEWNWKEAEKNFKKALELNPNYPTAHQWYALYLCSVGRFNEAFDQINRAMELDPLSLAIYFAKGLIFYYSCQFDESIKQFNKLLDIDNKFGVVYFWCSLNFFQKGMHEECFKEFQNMLSTDPTTKKDVPAFVNVYHDSGIKGIFGWLIDEAFIPNQETYNKSFYLSLYYAALGDKEHALECLEQAVDMHNVRIAYSIKTDPVFDPLRKDRRFSKLLTKMGLS